MVFCTYCGRSFTRNEHLHRHVLTHTKVRPFRCAICHSSFTRHDIIQKHYQSHSQEELASIQYLNDPASEGPHKDCAAPVRPRILVACKNCAKSKTRCDHKHPCGRCEAKGLVCETQTSKRSRRSFVSLSNGSIPNLPTPKATDSSLTTTPDARRPETSALTFAAVQNPEDPQVIDPFSSGDTSHEDNDCQQGQRFLAEPNATGPTMPPGEPEDTADTSYVTGNKLQDAMNLEQASELETADAEAEKQSPTPAQWNWSATMVPEVLQSPLTLANPETFSFPRNYIWSEMPEAPFLDITMDSSTPALAVQNPPPQTSESYSVGDASFFALDLILDQCPQPPLDSLALLPTDGVDDHALDSDNLNQPTDELKWPENVAELEPWHICKCIPLPKVEMPVYQTLDMFDLDQSFNDPGSWSDSAAQYRNQTFQHFERISHAALTETTREWMLVIVQSFLRITLESRGLRHITQSDRCQPTSKKSFPEFFMFLPPNRSLYRYLDIYLCTFDPFYPLVPALSLNANKLATNSNERGATLLLLLMVALGSSLDPSPKAKRFSLALSEICRHALRDIVEDDIAAYRSSLNLQCALLFVTGAAFSGWKMHMDIAIGQKNMFLTMMRYNNFFQPRPPGSVLHTPEFNNLEAVWKAWIDAETTSRLAFCWIVADQELSLFYDCPPFLTLSELNSALPSDERLWLAPTANEWNAILAESTQDAPNSINTFLRRSPMSLRSLFMQFLQSGNAIDTRTLQPTHLRLLLYPLQILVSHLRQFAGTHVPSTERSNYPVQTVQASYALRRDEIHRLFDRWLDLCEECLPSGTRAEAAMQATMVMYHLIHLNLLTNFSDLEAIARGESGYPVSLSPAGIDAVFEDHEAVLGHCGQIVQLVRHIDKKLRPNWWAAAIYRIAIIMWSWGVTAQMHPNRNRTTLNDLRPEPAIMLDGPSFRDPTLTQYMRKRKGSPCIRKQDGTAVPLTDPKSTLSVCMEVLEAGPKMCRFTEGILQRLESLTKAWDVVHKQKTPWYVP